MPSGSEETTTPGYDQAAVNAWISENVEGLTPPFRWEQLEGGHSNLTYAITDTEGREAVIRRPPMGELLPKAHDMGREFKIISGLGDTNVPVAKAYGYCEDPNVTGAHFYVMSKVPGRAMYSPAFSRSSRPHGRLVHGDPCFSSLDRACVCGS